MNTQKFGAFIAAVRKEQKMTQAELGEKLRVTDKAVSRWERGLGFPDINTLEPLADALGLTVLELMRSERLPEPALPVEKAAEALSSALTAAEQQRKQLIKTLLRNLILSFVGILAVLVGWFTLTGLMTRKDVFLVDYAALPSGTVITIRAGVAGPMGYIRRCADISDDPTEARLRFYSAFGGLNSRMGAKNVFLIPVDEECSAICFEGRDDPVLIRDPSGKWVLPT